MTARNTPTPPTPRRNTPQKHRGVATDASTDATDTATTDTGGPLLTGAGGGAPPTSPQENDSMTTPHLSRRHHTGDELMTTNHHDLGDRLRRLAPWADATPPVHHVAVSIAIDRLAVLLGMTVDIPPADATEADQ